MASSQHFIVWREPGLYGGWPANYGVWSWDDEIVVGFLRCALDTSAAGHKRDRSSPAVTMLARTTDGGVTWTASPFSGRTPGGRALSGDEHQTEGLKAGDHLDGPDAPAQLEMPLEFTHPDFALMCARTGLGRGTRSWFYASRDRCRTWSGPFWLPMMGQTGVEARTDYLVSGQHEATLFLTATKSNGREGRIFCARTTDGARSLDLLSYIGPEPVGYSIIAGRKDLTGTCDDPELIGPIALIGVLPVHFRQIQSFDDQINDARRMLLLKETVLRYVHEESLPLVVRTKVVPPIIDRRLLIHGELLRICLEGDLHRRSHLLGDLDQFTMYFCVTDFDMCSVV